MLGVNLKVIKALESGHGNPGFASIEKIAEALAAGKLSEQQLNTRNALKIGRIGLKIPSP